MMQLVINGSLVEDIASFYDEINRVFMADENWKIGPSLDAFDDLLYGGFGVIRNAERVEVVWQDIEKSRAALGYEATKAYFLEKLKPGSQFNSVLFEAKLAALENGTGETYFDTILNIIAEHKNITLKN
ncbi:barstar family protein [Dyadobacter sp. CY343]|uniref:barstar family protein n=1 Tax=Dyadobacter sp. CY343 TaxID=2907299 RepID=UPI001F1F6D92|nr:barstar family protein [Dyadobacter sp. CY343]MCE7063116.1 barstar family protein [Dyadobacter sp. CY343]